MLFFQHYPSFNRFYCKLFLTEAFQYLPRRSSSSAWIDNTHVVVLRGTGKTMIPVPEIEAFAHRFGLLGIVTLELPLFGQMHRYRERKARRNYDKVLGNIYANLVDIVDPNLGLVFNI